MPADIIVGLQWGDEGKGKLVDYLAANFDYRVIARYQGGRNAGHTVISNGKKYVFHAVPSGVLHPHITNVIGNGTVIDIGKLRQEIEELTSKGLDINPNNLVVSYDAHAIMPYHIEKEQSDGLKKINTTGYGIGPAYTSKAERSGVRLCDLACSQNPETRDYVREQIRKNTRQDPDELISQLGKDLEFIRPFINDASLILNNCLSRGERVLCEGAQGTLLDVDHGTYPYVTSSNTVASGAPTGLGINLGHFRQGKIIGVAKAYTTRVGDGPFPTELGDQESVKSEKMLDRNGKEFNTLQRKVTTYQATRREIGQYIRNVGGECGSSTGRNRRCGWLDIPLLEYAKRINGVTDLAIMKLDVLDTIPSISACGVYENYRDYSRPYNPTRMVLEKPVPLYRRFRGWGSTKNAKSWDDIENEAQRYLQYIQGEIREKIKFVSVGPDREQTIGRGSFD